MNKFSRLLNVFVAVVMVIAMGAIHQPAAASPSRDDATPGMDFVPGEVVVGFTAGSDVKAYTAQATALAGSVNAQVVSQDGNMALLSFDQSADVAALATQITAMDGVAYAEPNYVYSIPETFSTVTTRPDDPTSVIRTGPDGSSMSVSIDTLKSLRTVKGSGTAAVYPNDPYAFTNWGWNYTGAEIVWQNTTASANVCELDTGVDYLHPDLAGKIIKGLDFVNNDADPMDDNGHGTHVAGILAAVPNNKIGIAGVSTGKVVAVKVLNAQGWGTNYGISAGINYCANRTDIKVLNMSLGGLSNSFAMQSAISYAIDIKGKMVVAAAGNNSSSGAFYPAAWSVGYSGQLLAVAAIDNGDTSIYGCRASYSNYGSYVSVAAPGTNIYSTLPYDKPFYLNYYDGISARYDYLSGTSMATPFVAAAAARRWGYKPTETNAQVGTDVKTGSLNTVYADGSCWPASMSGIHMLNVAYLLDRGAGYAYVYNATTGLPLLNAQVQAYQGTILKGSAVLSSYASAYTEVINLPVGSGYTEKVNLSGVTNGAQPAFQQTSSDGSHAIIWGGLFTNFGRATIPNMSANFDVVTGWGTDPYAETGDLDMDIWLPLTPNPLDAGQPGNFEIGNYGNSHTWLEGDPIGTLLAFPFGIANREGGFSDNLDMESTTVSRRLAHTPLVANSALPYYPGTYKVGITDWGQMSSGNPADTKLYWTWPYAYVWKDGAVKAFVEQGNCDTHWYFPFDITSGISGAVTITPHGPGYAATGCATVTPYDTGFSTSGSSTQHH